MPGTPPDTTLLITGTADCANWLPKPMRRTAALPYTLPIQRPATVATSHGKHLPPSLAAHIIHRYSRNCARNLRLSPWCLHSLNRE